jgi:uncharacterized protein
MPQAANSAIDFVVKISKFCNLRCNYCYEFAELGDRHRMSLTDLRAFFVNVRSAVRAYGRNHIHFVWHGGEPFLIPLDYYEQIGALQQEVFAGGITYANLVQTNLTVLTERHVDFLREHRFFTHAIGVSFDVYGDQRVDTRGRLRTQTVLANLQRLKDAGIAFGAITVLARNTVAHVAEIHRFYDSLGISVRFLPFYKSASDEQVAQHSLTFEEITTSFKTVFDAWLVSERAPAMHPLEDYIRYALAAMAGRRPRMHEPDTEEQVFLIGTHGDVFGVADTYVPGRCYGNVFREDLGVALRSAERAQVVAESRERMERYCASCPYFGYCPGRFAAEATAEQRRMLATDGCPVRELVGHIIQRLQRTSIAEKMARERAESLSEPPALAVGA